MINLLISILIAAIIALYIFFSYRASSRVEKTEDSIAGEKSQEKETEHKEQQLEEEKEEKEQIYLLNTHFVKYKIYDTYNLNYKAKILHDDFALKKFWIQELYYSTFFRLLSFFDRDLLFVKDPSSEVFVLNIRGEDNREVKTKAYKVISIMDIASRILKINKNKILKFEQSDAQNIVLAVFLYCISKSKQFQAIDIKDICPKFLEDYPFQEDVVYIISLFEEEGSQIDFVGKSYQKVLEYCDKHPYTEDENEKHSYNIKLIPQLPQKRLRHI